MSVHKVCAVHLESEILLTGRGGLAGIDVADNDDIDMSLFLTIDGSGVSISMYSEGAAREILG